MSDISKIRVNGSDYTIKDAEGRTLIATKAPIASPTFTGTPLAPTADSNADNTQIANTAWVNDRIDAAIATSDAMIFKGTIGKEGATITTKTLPNSTAKTGWTYKAAEAGNYTVGTGTGTGTTTVKCEVGDMIIALTDGSSSTYATWVVVQANIDGAVTGPASSTANHIATFSDTSGKIIKDSGFTIATSVPENAVFTDQSVTAVGNHYTPTGTTTKSASGATGTSGTTVQVVTGVTMDAKGHVTAVTSGAATDTLNTVGGTDSSTQLLYAVGVLASGRDKASAPSYTDHYVTFTDGHIDCDGANIEGDTTIGTAAINRALTVNGTIASTGARLIQSMLSPQAVLHIFSLHLLTRILGEAYRITSRHLRIQQSLCQLSRVICLPMVQLGIVRRFLLLGKLMGML